MDRREATPRDQVGRAVGIVGLLGIALIHFLDAFSVIDESKFVFGLYILLMIVTVLASGILLRTDSRLTWMLAGGAAGLTLIGFILTRTTGLPGFPDNVGELAGDAGPGLVMGRGHGPCAQRVQGDDDPPNGRRVVGSRLAVSDSRWRDRHVRRAMLSGVDSHLTEGGHAMLGAAIVIPGIIVLILIILIIIYFVRRA